MNVNEVLVRVQIWVLIIRAGLTRLWSGWVIRKKNPCGPARHPGSRAGACCGEGGLIFAKA